MAEAQIAAVTQAAALVEEAAELSSNFSVQLCAEERSSRVAKLHAAALELLTSVDCGAGAACVRRVSSSLTPEPYVFQRAALHLPLSAAARCAFAAAFSARGRSRAAPRRRTASLARYVPQLPLADSARSTCCNARCS